MFCETPVGNVRGIEFAHMFILIKPLFFGFNLYFCFDPTFFSNFKSSQIFIGNSENKERNKTTIIPLYIGHHCIDTHFQNMNSEKSLKSRPPLGKKNHALSFFSFVDFFAELAEHL